MTLVLVVEDETLIAEVLTAYLKREDYTTHWLTRGDAVLPWIAQKKPDLILLDIMLPGTDGLALCRRIRGSSSVPIILVTARVEEIDRLLGLELGADDYICKPFSPREVVARVKAVLRRTAAPAPVTSWLEIDEAGLVARLHGTRLDLTPTEFGLLAILARRAGRVLSHADLMDAVAASDRGTFERTIGSHIKNLRRKLAAVAGEQEIIQSSYGVGYRLEVPE